MLVVVGYKVVEVSPILALYKLGTPEEIVPQQPFGILKALPAEFFRLKGLITLKLYGFHLHLLAPIHHKGYAGSIGHQRIGGLPNLHLHVVVPFIQVVLLYYTGSCIKRAGGSLLAYTETHFRLKVILSTALSPLVLYAGDARLLGKLDVERYKLTLNVGDPDLYLRKEVLLGELFHSLGYLFTGQFYGVALGQA